MTTKQYDNYADLITFTRGSSGTALRPVGYGAELVTNGTFDSGTTGFTASGATLSNVSNQLVSTSTGSGFAGRAETTVSTVVGKVYYFSGLAVSSTGGNTYAAVRVGTSVAGQENIANTQITLGQVFSFSFVATATTTHLSLVGSGTSGIENVWDNISVKEVIFDRAGDPLTLFNHPTNVPRIEYDASGNRKGLLIEEARTNLVTHSVVSTANWSGVSVTTEQLSNNYLGVFSGVRVASTGATWNRLRSAQTISVSSGTAYTLTAWFVAGTSGRARIVLRDNTNFTETRVIGPIGALGINAETFGSLTNLIQETIGNIHKVSFTVTANATVSNASVEIGPETVNAGQDIILLGAQVEAGSFPTSYIPTSGSTATRSADVASIPTSAFGYNQKAGTVVVDFETQYGTTGFPRIWEIGNTSTNINRVNLYIFAALSRINFDAFSNNVGAAGFIIKTDPTPASGKFGTAFADNDFVGIVDGGSPVTDISGSFTTPSIPRDTLFFGRDNASGSLLNGHIKSIQYYPRRLTNAQLQRLTA